MSKVGGLFTVLVVLGISAPSWAASTPSMEEMWRVIQKQQAEIDVLRRKLADAEQKADAAVLAVESGGAVSAHAMAANNRTHLGGYGEMHLNNLQGEGGAADKDQIDFHRFVLMVNHEFSDRLRLFTELELEHALVKDNNDGGGGTSPGEVELEQAYIEYDLNEKHRAKAGLFLLPVGILNETHEPNTFYGVERNSVEKNIIPTTWWAGGVGVSGDLAPGFSYDLALHEGLATTAGGTYNIRSGRQKTAEASSKDPAWTGRLKWTGVPGLELAGSVQLQQDITQDMDSAADQAMLYELHGVLNRGAFGLRALYAHWDLNGSGPASVGADVQKGWYFEPSWRLNEKWGVFTRYSTWDNQAGSNAGTAMDSEKTQYDVGLNYWLHENVVLKADYQVQDNDNDRNQDGFNFGVGFHF